MDNLIANPLKRLISNSATFAKNQISEFYNNKSVKYSAASDTALINMTEMNTINSKTTFDQFDDSSKTINSQNETELNSPHKIKICKTKLVDQPVKHVVKYVNNNANVLSSENIQIINELEPTSPQFKKTLPVIKIKVKLINNNTKRNKTEEAISAENPIILHNTQSNEVSQNIENCDNFHAGENLESIKVLQEVESLKDLENSHSLDYLQGLRNTEDLGSPKKFEKLNESKISFVSKSNISYALSATSSLQSSTSQKFRLIDELIDFHEQQAHHNRKPFQRVQTLPRMGTSALYNIRSSPERKSKSFLTDPEIISAMVHDRFIVNLYESRTYKRQLKSKKPSTYGRIFRSLERDTASIPNFNNTYDTEFKNEIISMKQSSPIKLRDQFSLNSKETSNLMSFNYDDEFQHIKDEEILDEEKFIEHLTLHEEKSSSSIILYPQTSNKNDDEIKILEENTVFKNEDVNVIFEDTNYPNSNSKTTEITENKLEGNMTKTISQPLEETEPSSYNMEEFLQKALGEEYNSRLDSTIESESSKEKIVSPETIQILQEESVCTSDASDLISKINSFQSNIYRSLTKRIQQMSDTLKISPAPKHDKQEKTCDDLEVIFPNNEVINELVRQAAVQYESMKQITKALTVCRNSKQFSVSTEQVEGERLLLVANYKRQVILDEIRRLDYEMEASNSTAEKGTVLISKIALPLKEDSADQIVTSRRDYSKYYVCIFSCGPRVFATQPATANAEGNICFSEEVIFTELPSDFTIHVEVYSLLQRRPNRNFSHESKYHINKEVKSTHCPTPKKFLQREKRKNQIPTRYDTGIRASSFKSCGNLKLRVADLCKSDEWYLRKIPLCSILNGSIFLNIQSIVKIPIKYCGFLTVGHEAKGGSAVWNRRWCILDGHILRYWNYPCDEDTHNPLRELDLKYCTNAQIESANREICARPRTLSIEIVQPSKSYTIERTFLSADCNSDLQQWELNFNLVIRAIHIWNAAYK